MHLRTLFHYLRIELSFSVRQGRVKVLQTATPVRTLLLLQRKTNCWKKKMEMKTAPLIKSEVYLTTWIRTESGREELLHNGQTKVCRDSSVCFFSGVTQSCQLDRGSGEDDLFLNVANFINYMKNLPSHRSEWRSVYFHTQTPHYNHSQGSTLFTLNQAAPSERCSTVSSLNSLSAKQNQKWCDGTHHDVDIRVFPGVTC